MLNDAEDTVSYSNLNNVQTPYRRILVARAVGHTVGELNVPARLR